MQKYKCGVCGYIYKPPKGADPSIKPWTPFQDLPDDWVCPVCWANQSQFSPINKYQNITKASITNIDKLTSNVIELTIQTDKLLDYKPGQYLNFILKDQDGQFIREYSITNSQNKNLPSILFSKWYNLGNCKLFFLNFS